MAVPNRAKPSQTELNQPKLEEQQPPLAAFAKANPLQTLSSLSLADSLVRLLPRAVCMIAAPHQDPVYRFESAHSGDEMSGMAKQTLALRLASPFSPSWKTFWLSVLLAAAVECLGHSTTLGQEEPKLQYPIDVAAGKQGVFIADRTLPGIWKVKDGKPAIFFRAQKKFRTPLNAIRCLALDADGRLLAGDSSTRNVYRFGDDGKPTKLLTNRIGVGIPMALSVDSKGRVLIADLEQHQILAVAAEGGEPTKVAAVRAPRGLAVDSEDQIWVVSHGKNQLVRIKTDGAVETIVEGRPFDFPHHIAFDGEGAAYIADGYGKTIWKIAKDGKPAAWSKGKPLDNPVGAAWHDGKLLIADSRATMIFSIGADGKAQPFLKP